MQGVAMTEQIGKCELDVVRAEYKTKAAIAQFLGKSIDHLFPEHQEMAAVQKSFGLDLTNIFPMDSGVPLLAACRT